MIGDHDFHLALAYGVSAALVTAELVLLWRRAHRAARSAATLQARRHEQAFPHAPDTAQDSTASATTAIEPPAAAPLTSSSGSPPGGQP